MSNSTGKTAGHGVWWIYGIACAVMAVQIQDFYAGVLYRSVFALADSLFVLIFSAFLCWSFARGYRWARFALAYFAIAMLVTAEGVLPGLGLGGDVLNLLSNAVYFTAAACLIFAPRTMLAALESARTSSLGPDEVLSDRDARRRGRRILAIMIVAIFAAQLTWMLPAWWRMGTEPGLTEALVMSVIALIAVTLWRRSENARAWAWLLSFGACFWFLALGVFAPEPNDFFIAIGLAHLAIPSALVSWRSVQVYFGDKDLDAKWEYVRPTPRRPKAWGEAHDGSAALSADRSPKRSV